MKKILLPILVLFLALLVNAQPRASEGTIDYQGVTKPAATFELPYPEAVVEKAIKEYMAKKGMKGTDSKGFKVFHNYKLRDSQELMSDLYFKTARKNRKESEMTNVYLVPLKAGEDIKTAVVTDNSAMEAAKELLNDMVFSIDSFNLEVQVNEQEDVLKKAQRKYDGMVNDQRDYEKRIKNLQDKLEENKKDQQKQQDELKRQQTILEALRSKRKG